MTKNLTTLFSRIETSRNNFLNSVTGLNMEQAQFKPANNEWSILEITEHIVWAEQIGICGMFKAIEGIKNGRPIWSGISENKGLTIEEIVEKTWQPKEQVPKVAEPRWGGSIDYWTINLKNNRLLLSELKEYAEGIDLHAAIYPHPISGPMDVVQRLEFLSFHLDRHRGQVERVKSNKNFPV